MKEATKDRMSLQASSRPTSLFWLAVIHLAFQTVEPEDKAEDLQDQCPECTSIWLRVLANDIKTGTPTGDFQNKCL